MLLFFTYGKGVIDFMAIIDIVLVEDNRHDIEMILDALEEFCISDRIRVLREGAEAVDYIFGPQGCDKDANGALPKLIILDLKLPKINGMEILKRIKSDERTRYIPTVVFTSSNEMRDRHESYQLGANSYIVKPLDADKFSQFVKDMGSYWLSMNETLYE
jgi:two-component system, response regulator